MKQLFFALIILVTLFSCGKNSQEVNNNPMEEIATEINPGICTEDVGTQGRSCGMPTCNGSTTKCCKHCDNCPPPPPPPCPNPPCTE